jgi:hypothetical protein
MQPHADLLWLRTYSSLWYRKVNLRESEWLAVCWGEQIICCFCKLPSYTFTLKYSMSQSNTHCLNSFPPFLRVRILEPLLLHRSSTGEALRGDDHWQDISWDFFFWIIKCLFSGKSKIDNILWGILQVCTKYFHSPFLFLYKSFT